MSIALSAELQLLSARFAKAPFEILHAPCPVGIIRSARIPYKYEFVPTILDKRGNLTAEAKNEVITCLVSHPMLWLDLKFFLTEGLGHLERLLSESGLTVGSSFFKISEYAKKVITSGASKKRKSSASDDTPPLKATFDCYRQICEEEKTRILRSRHLSGPAPKLEGEIRFNYTASGVRLYTRTETYPFSLELRETAPERDISLPNEYVHHTRETARQVRDAARQNDLAVLPAPGDLAVPLPRSVQTSIDWFVHQVEKPAKVVEAAPPADLEIPLTKPLPKQVEVIDLNDYPEDEEILPSRTPFPEPLNFDKKKDLTNDKVTDYVETLIEVKKERGIENTSDAALANFTTKKCKVNTDTFLPKFCTCGTPDCQISSGERYWKYNNCGCLISAFCVTHLNKGSKNHKCENPNAK